jgi:uncharacterized protein (DUF2141 family)
MKSLLLIIAISFTMLIFGQTEQFYQKMGQALQKYGQCETAENYLESAMDFDQIASVETESWLPSYYEAMCYTMASFQMLAPEAAQKDEHLDKAEAIVGELKKANPGESEIFALESLYLTARLSVDPMARGRKYSGLSMMAVSQALAMEPKNPRARYIKLINEIGMARFFGKDITPYCQEANTILAEWDKYTVKSQLHPNWGKPQVQGILQECGAKSDEGNVKTEKKELEKASSTLSIAIEDIKSDKGVILAELKNEKGEVVQVTKGNIAKGKSSIEFQNLPKGNYSLSFFHDENENMKLDSGKYGPTEGYGFSNDAKGFMSAPKFEKTLFELNGDLMITLKTRN